jgi:hypothetical protein
MVENIAPINGRAAYPTPGVGGPDAPSCYRVSLLSGAVEVTARLKCCDDLDLLLKVLEANRPHFLRADRLANEILTLSPAAEHSMQIATSGAETEGFTQEQQEIA